MTLSCLEARAHHRHPRRPRLPAHRRRPYSLVARATLMQISQSITIPKKLTHQGTWSSQPLVFQTTSTTSTGNDPTQTKYAFNLSPSHFPLLRNCDNLQVTLDWGSLVCSRLVLSCTTTFQTGMASTMSRTTQTTNNLRLINAMATLVAIASIITTK